MGETRYRSGDVTVTLSGELEAFVRGALKRAAGEVKVSVGSTDERISGRRPVPVYVRRPGRLSLRKVSVSHETYWKTTPSLRANYHPVPGRDPKETSGPYVFEANPKASDGKTLLPLLVKNPVKKALRAAASELGAAISGGKP